MNLVVVTLLAQIAVGKDNKHVEKFFFFFLREKKNFDT